MSGKVRGKKGLDSVKIRRHVAFLDELPMTSTGKIQKQRALREWPEAPPL